MNTEAQSYIPQRSPFVMIGTLISADETHTKTSFDIKADNLFVTDGRFSESGLVENMAQTAGAGTGYMIQQRGDATPIGFIAALKNVNIISLPLVDDTIVTEINFLQNLLGFHLVKGKVTIGEQEIANCEFKIFVNPEQPK